MNLNIIAISIPCRIQRKETDAFESLLIAESILDKYNQSYKKFKKLKQYWKYTIITYSDEKPTIKKILDNGIIIYACL